MANNSYNRRNFFKTALAGIGIGMTALWGIMLKQQQVLNENKVITLPFNPNKGVNFIDDFIILNKQGITTVFSSRCTHLGCRINHHKNNELLCPCHGSSFTMEGEVIKGPAVTPLKKLDFEINSSGDFITVKA